MRHQITVATIVLSLATIAMAAPRKIFEVTFNDVPGGGLVCEVVFHGELPKPAMVDTIVHRALESAVLLDGTKDILAMAFVGDEAMRSTQYSGSLMFKASEKRIMTMDEYRGIKTTGGDAGGYYVQVKEEKTFDGIKPQRKWLNITLVFATAPVTKEAYAKAMAEVEKVSGKGIDANVYVSVGDKEQPTSWQQMRDVDGYVFVEYTAATKTISRKGKSLKQLQVQLKAADEIRKPDLWTKAITPQWAILLNEKVTKAWNAMMNDDSPLYTGVSCDGNQTTIYINRAEWKKLNAFQARNNLALSTTLPHTDKTVIEYIDDKSGDILATFTSTQQLGSIKVIHP